MIMTSRHRLPAMSMEQSSSALSEINPLQELSVFSPTQGLFDRYSFEDIFQALVKDINDLAEKTMSYEREFCLTQDSSKRTRTRRSTQNSKESEYMEILNMKGNFVEELTNELYSTDFSIDIPRCRLHCYQQLASLFADKCLSVNHDIQLRIEELTKMEEDIKMLQSEIDVFTKIKNMEEDTEKREQEDQRKLVLQEVKADMMMILSVIYPENVKNEFVEAMAELTDAYVNNLENEEDQYVEFSPVTLRNRGLRCLVEGCVIIHHPSNTKKFRICLEE